MVNYKSPLYQVDAYKTGHGPQYPEGTEFVYSNKTARSDRIARMNNDVLKDFDGKVVNFGLLGVIKEFFIDCFNEEFFSQDKATACSDYAMIMDHVLGPNMVGAEHWEELHDLGYLPIQVKALPEGMRVPIGVPLFTFVNTDKRFHWLTNYLETVTSSETWQTITSATIAYEYKRLLLSFAEKTGVDPMFVGIQGHDFSFRGINTRQGAVKSSIGHLSSFIGTDTISAIPYLMQFYNATLDGPVPIGVSVPATEHSVMCLGSKEGEIETR